MSYFDNDIPGKEWDEREEEMPDYRATEDAERQQMEEEEAKKKGATVMSFEEFLKDQHMELFPALLDDDIPDHFDNWLGSLNSDDFIGYADAFAIKILTQ